jgi:TRAP-type mannitol/chloroaromatic compound transport system substrate-binding protein
MKRRQFVTAVGGGGLAAALAAGSGPAIAQGRKEWRMQMTWAKNSPALATGANALAEFVSKATGGQLTVKVYAAGEIVPALQTMDAVANGSLHMGHGYPAYWGGKLPAINFLSPLPFSITSQEQNAWFAYGGGQEIADKLYAKLGVKFFPSGNTSVQAAGWYNKEVKAIGDFKGLKIRAGGMGGKVLQAAGAAPVQIALGEVPQALQSGAIDGADFVGPYNDMAFGLHKVAKFYYWPGWQEPCGALDCFVNLQAWDSLSAEQKEILRVGNEYANARVLNEFVAKNAEAFHELVNVHKIQVRLFNDDTLKALGELAGQVIRAEAAKDADSQMAFDSLMKFRERTIPYTKIAEYEFMRARALPFKYI